MKGLYKRIKDRKQDKDTIWHLTSRKENDIVKEKLKVPATYMIPIFIGIGYADPNEHELEQQYPEIDKQLHFGKWK